MPGVAVEHHDVVVIGGGWSGMAAAVTLADAGVRVLVLEASDTLGGRARRIELDGMAFDNGQHLLLGAYRQFRLGKKDSAQSLEHVFDLFPRLKERRTQLAGTLSGGERQMLALGRALMSKPTLLMLDEPSLGLAPLVVRDIFKTIDGLRATGVTILLVEQNARAALEVADYGYVLEMGEIALEGPARELAKDSRVIDTYLGAARKPAV